ncbi:ECF transporter S component [Spiroplasma endosymbiont of Amphibalanus improvisus]|uniref:ECF transporter S component n=1 Tax=Spiroplasma endosymbiont of Amphibalanus improvisus TaxID=3066327 RepID=UPI00313EEE3B
MFIDLFSISNISDKFLSIDLAYFSSFLMIGMLICYSIYSGIVYKFYPNSYRGIRLSTKNITYIALLSATSVTFTVIISIILPITVFPPVRIAFEGVMVKITGYLFGPIVGALSGLITEMLTILFIPSFIHISYLIVIISYGFLAGLFSAFNNAVGKQKWIFYFFVNVVMMLTAILACVLIYNNNSTLFGIDFPTILFTSFFAISFGLSILFMSLAAFMEHSSKNKKSKLIGLFPIAAFACVSEFWITAFISSWGDLAFLTALNSGSQDSDGYKLTLLARMLEAPLKILFNTAVLFITYKTIFPLVDKKNVIPL